MVERLLKTFDGKKIQIHPTCFYLEWDADVPNARWLSLDELPKDKVQFSSYAKWKDLRYDVYVASDTKNLTGSTLHVQQDYHNVSYLKSHLQKVIRRSNSYKALKTAWNFMDLDLSDFLRRLAIIALEDCLPLDGFPVLIWFLAAVSKGYILNDAQVCYILGYVYDLSRCTYYEQHVHNDDKLPTQRDMRLFTLSPEGKNLIYSILFRQSYGGMKSDAAMCRVAALAWANRYHTKSRFLKLLSRPSKYITPPSCGLGKSEWVLASIDFHCCPNIIGAMWEKHDQYTEDEIRSAVWHCSSSVTDKKILTEDLHQRNMTDSKLCEIWRVIRKDFLGYAKFMLEKQG